MPLDACARALPCRHNFAPGSRLVLAGTIQFASCIQAARQQLAAEYEITVPQVRQQAGPCPLGVPTLQPGGWGVTLAAQAAGRQQRTIR